MTVDRSTQLVRGAGAAAGTEPPARATSAGSPGSGRQSGSRTGSEREARRRAIRRAMRIGIWVWPAFTLLDAYMCFVVYPRAPFGLFLVYRALLEIPLLAVYRSSGRPGGSLGGLAWAQTATFCGAGILISLMALHLGGLVSPYMHGLSIVILVRSTVMPDRWQRGLALSVPIALCFPLVMGLAAFASPAVRAQWTSPATLALFFSHDVFVLASSLVGMAAGHAVWSAQQQVYRARRLGRYRLQAPLGEGGMGEVWLAWDEARRAKVVLKLLRADHAPDPAFVRRFEREARAASRLTGPHSIRIHDFGASDDGIYYIAMEYLAGMDLGALVREYGALPPARAVRFALQACESLQEAHDAGIVHRDIKPHNLFVTRVGDDFDHLKLLDFGLARLVESEGDSQLTRTGFLPGTPAYLAPELWAGAPADARSDLYALGVTLYVLLAGRTPFEAETPGAYLEAHRELLPPPPSERCAAPLPAGLDDIVLRCLAKRPEARYASAEELRRALAAVHDPAAWTPADARAFWRAARLPGFEPEADGAA